MAFRLVIFDLGGVLVTRAPERMIEEFAAAAGRPPMEVARMIADPAMQAFEMGRMSPVECFDHVRRQLGLPWDFARFTEAWNGMLGEDRAATALLAPLRRRYQLSVLSNTNPLHDAHIRSRWPAFGQIQRWTVSYEVGMMKPDPRIYAQALEQAGVRAAEAVYVDDVEEFVEAGRRVGLTAIHRTPESSLERQLQAAGIETR
jgi:putative hydrolase of the HAD superfamily